MSTTIVKTLEHPLSTTAFSKKEYNRLVKSIHDLDLVKTGICRRFPNAVKHGPKSIMGLGFTNLCLVQEIKNLKLHVEERNKGNFAAKLMQANYENSLLHPGIGGK